MLANDGRGTNVLKDLASVSYLILPEKISEEEEELQKNITFSSNVLGESTDNTQMRFYEEGSVLGARVGEEIQEKKKFSLLKTFLGGLEKVDRFILEQWGRYLSF